MPCGTVSCSMPPAADIIRLLPPLIIEQEDIDALAEALPTIYEEVAR